MAARRRTSAARLANLPLRRNKIAESRHDARESALDFRGRRRRQCLRTCGVQFFALDRPPVDADAFATMACAAVAVANDDRPEECAKLPEPRHASMNVIGL